jgi:hypothetical protein
MLRQSFTTTALAAGLTLGFADTSEAALLAGYNFDGNSLSSIDTDANSVASDIVLGFSPNDSNPLVNDNTLSFITSGGGSTDGPSGFFTGTANSDALSFNNVDYEEQEGDALADGQFVAFTLTAAPLTTLDLEQLSYGHARSGSAPRRLSVYTQLAGETGFTEQKDSANNGTTTFNSNDYFTLDLSSITGFDSATSVEFRLVFHDDNSSPGSGYLENIAVSGTATVIPEPASLALLGLGGLCLAGGRRQRSA